MPNPLTIALKGKGLTNALRRSASIVNRYGMTAARLADQLRQLAELTQAFGSRATLPITTVVLQRNPAVIRRFQAEGVEFAIHGYHHIDHSQIGYDAQRRRLTQAREAFAAHGIALRGFRGPYLRFNSDTLRVLRELGLAYDASQAIAWEVIDEAPAPYARALDFYRAMPAAQAPSVPWLEDGLVRIPYSLPDDESLVERLGALGPDQMTALWLAVLRRAHGLGELFTIGLHPERTTLLLAPLRAVLAEAKTLQPGVWLARLDEVADWWRARAMAEVTLSRPAEGLHRVSVAGGPPGLTLLARGDGVAEGGEPWADGYRRLPGLHVEAATTVRPWIGLSPRTPAAIAAFLREQGYLVQIDAVSRPDYSVFIDRDRFALTDRRALLAEVEATPGPFVRLGRWPNGARSALAVTGDIDALTVWDYGLRFLER